MTNIESQGSKLSPSDIGIAIVLMEDMGPQTFYNISELDEIASMYLAIKGFTAFMTGFESNIHGPGKIRGIIQIPDTNLYAFAIDLNMLGSGFEDDIRLQKNRMAIVCIIANSVQLNLIRQFYTETEKFIIERLKIITTVNHLNESFCLKLIQDYNHYIKELVEKNALQQSKVKIQTKRSLYEVGVLLSLTKDENLTGRVIMQASSENKKGITIEEISKITKRKIANEKLIVEHLLEKGLIIAIYNQEDKEKIRYIAQ